MAWTGTILYTAEWKGGVEIESRWDVVFCQRSDWALVVVLFRGWKRRGTILEVEGHGGC